MEPFTPPAPPVTSTPHSPFPPAPSTFSILSRHPWCVPRAGSASHRLDHHLHFVCVLRQMFHPSVLSGRVSSARAPRAPVDCACGELPPHSPTCPSVRPSAPRCCSICLLHMASSPSTATASPPPWSPFCLRPHPVSPLSGSLWACVSASPRRIFTQPCRAQVAFRCSGH